MSAELPPAAQTQVKHSQDNPNPGKQQQRQPTRN
eukprot:CAMPEP_0204400126 /NCGR_PEP_ID=MMETSP0470-20130426/3900_1 /ASSEMBLY_ACC=CAM_ASM_000385 /TAXON_ID=2969 /ORGANISM="Oxyrrhis marina" /LENGTH=33 /DNA_ID= /DNA_START= /DNA_END= /DNA_ORIENTATION=